MTTPTFWGEIPAFYLDPESVEAIARRVVALLAGTEAAGMIDAAELARRLGVRRDYVYRNKERLGAVRVGEGKRARLRFDPDAALSGATDAAAPAPSARRGRPRRPGGSRVELLPIKGGRLVA